MNKNYFTYYKLVFWLCILIFINFLFGPWVRATDSGLACPDWPLCFGKWFPELQFNIWMEVGHRFYSGIISLVFLFLAVWTLRDKELRKYFLLSILLAVFLLIAQILLGMYTVTELLKPITVNLHLINAIVFFLVLVNVLVRSNYLKEKGYPTINTSSIVNPKNIFHLVVLFFVFYQIHVGAKVSSNYAGLSCPDFPQCIGDSWMPPKDEQGVRNKLGVLHVTHRYLAYFVFLLILALQMVSIFQKWSRPSKLFVKMSFHTAVLQIIVGIANIQFRLPPIITTLHTGLAVLIITFLFISFMIRIIETSKSS